MEGIVVFDYADRYCLAAAEMAGYLRAVTMKSKEDVMQGLENFTEALLKIFNGEKFGKLVLRCRRQQISKGLFMSRNFRSLSGGLTKSINRE